MMISIKDLQHLLPPIILEIIEIIGINDTLKLIKVIGGTSFKFSVGAKDCPRYRILCEAIGTTQTSKLLERFRGSDEYIPRCEAALRAARYEQFKHEFLHLTQFEKKSARMALLELCPKYQITERTGWKIIGNQMDILSQPCLI